jgi:ubiquinone/menaquinone biosynthesis C-methylase UbiE
VLERIQEQEVLDSERDALEYASFDNGAVNAEFVVRALELAPANGLVLDVGTGPGDISVLLAQRAPGLRIVAIDLGEHMLALARANVERAGLAERIAVSRRDAKATGLPPAHFDMVICNSLVHHVADPEALFRELRRVARPEAAFFIKDLHRPASKAELDQLVETYAAGCTAYQRQSFFDSLHSGLTVAEIEALCARIGWHDIDLRRCSDRHWCIERRASEDR